MRELDSRLLFTMRLGVTRLHDLGETPAGVRHIDILGAGRFEGPRLSGDVLADGIDEKLARPDGAMIPNVRLSLRTDDGALIYMSYTGVRFGSPEVMSRIAAGEIVDPSEYYLRNTPRFETGDRRYVWLNRVVAIGVGRREAELAAYDIFEIL